jgi:hypothetical protein
LFLGAGRAQAQGVRPWVPPQADSLVLWATEAKVAFQLNTGDSVSGSNFKAYSTVGMMGRRLLRSLGRDGMVQARAAETLLDSLGLDTEITLDPDMPAFALLMVRNPYKRTAVSIGFLYWYKGLDLRIQGAGFRGGALKPTMRVWWTGDQAHPYAWGVIDQSRGDDQRLHLKLFKLSPDGYYWDLVQWDDNEPDLGARGRAAFVDIDGDGRPEVVSWTPAARDSLFEECSGCPGLLLERTFVERRSRFELHDQRLLPSSWATFQLFVRLLMADDRRAAGRLLRDPTRVDAAIAAGWAASRKAGTWRMEGGEGDDRWPRWIEVRHAGPKGARKYIVHFEHKEGRWIISDWIPATPGRATGTGTSGTAAPGSPAREGRPSPDSLSAPKGGQR